MGERGLRGAAERLRSPAGLAGLGLAVASLWWPWFELRDFETGAVVERFSFADVLPLDPFLVVAVAGLSVRLAGRADRFPPRWVLLWSGVVGLAIAWLVRPGMELTRSTDAVVLHMAPGTILVTLGLGRVLLVLATAGGRSRTEANAGQR